MDSSPSLIRSACDRCHHKKIRCVPSRQANICIRCLELDLSCVFSPPGRNGRPPRNSAPDNSWASRSRSSTDHASRPQDDNCISTSSATVSTSSLVEDASMMSSNLLDFVHAEGLPQQLQDPNSFHDNFPTPIDLSEMQSPGLFTLDNELNLTHTAFPDHGLEQPNLTSSQPSSSMLSQSTTNMTAQSQGSSSMEDDQYQRTLTKLPSSSETTHILHVIQQDLHEVKAKVDISQSLSSSSTNFSEFFQLVERFHSLIRSFFASVPNPTTEATTAPCDFMTAISFVGTIVAMMDIYEVLACRCVTPYHDSQQSTINRACDSTMLDTELSGSISSPETSNIYTSISTSAAVPQPVIFNPDTVQIGCFTPSRDLAHWILTSILLYDIRTSRNLTDQMRRRFLQLRSTLHPKFPGSLSGRLHNRVSDAGITSLLQESSTVSILTSQSCITLLQLCEGLIMRQLEIERVIEQGIGRYQSDLKNY